MHLVVIGAGPHALAVLSALADAGSWPEHVTVVDPHDGWCSAWDRKLQRLDLDRLRSPQVHHPGVQPMAFRDMVEALPSTSEQLAMRREEAERAPTPAGMGRFIEELAARLGPVTWIRGRATMIETGTAASKRPRVRIMPLSHGANDLPAQQLECGATMVLDADAIVVAHNPSMPRIPDWAAPLVAAGRAVHASEVDVRSAEVAGRDVLIVGGGLTAACLALQSLARGGRPTLLARRALRARPYDVDASWIGPRRLEPYLRAPVEERRALIDTARDGGTIPPRTLADLRDAAADPARPLTILEDVDVETVLRDLLARTSPTPPLLWLATGFEQDITRDPLLGPVAQALGIPVHGGLPEVDEHLRLDDAPLFVTGPYAALAVGPACRNLAGARPAAQRIVAGLLSVAR